MSFLETPRFPENVSLELVGGPGYSTDVVTVRAGYESRNENWSQARHRLVLAHGGILQAQHDALLDHFHAVGGRAHSFRVKNWFDYQMTVANSGLVGLHGTTQVGSFGAGYGVPVYQICKRYARGALSRVKSIVKPVATPTVYRNGVAVAVGVGASQIAIDTTTGKVTFVADATRSVAAVTVGATTQIEVSASALTQVGIGDRLYLSGLTGADAALLNGLSHAVTGLTGTTYTLSTNTAGKTITVGSGVAAAYPQADETLTVAGEFDLPMRFTSDEAEFEVLDKNVARGLIFAWRGIELIEVRGE
jgi:uncharacterized protein (TIGR02217 family)